MSCYYQVTPAPTNIIIGLDHITSHHTIPYLSMVQTDESWCKHLTRLDLLKEEMVLQSFTAERDVMEVTND